jgi:hypothetical protein
MDPNDEYDLTSERWISALFAWAFKGCPKQGLEYDIMNRLDKKLKLLADKCVEAETD